MFPSHLTISLPHCFFLAGLLAFAIISLLAMARHETLKFLENPLGFAITHPIIVDTNPVDFSAAAMSLRTKWTANTQNRKGYGRHTQTFDEGLHLGTLEKCRDATKNNYKGYVLTSRPFANGQVVPKGFFPMWFLSWNNSSFGGQVDMRIPTEVVHDHKGRDVTPNIFFTAGLSGCSVFISAKKPGRLEVFHSGASDKTWEGTAVEHWRYLYAEHRLQNAVAEDFAEVHHTDYFSSVQPSEFTMDYLQGTQRIRTFINGAIRDEVHAHRSVDIYAVIGVGCVFGVRTPGTNDWQFYLQENVRVMYRRELNALPVSVNRALQVKQIWPRGNHAPFFNHVPKGLP